MDREPSVLIVGGVDVDQRLDLMTRLKGQFDVSAAGSADLEDRFAAQGFGYHRYHLVRGGHPGSDLRSLVELVRLMRREQPDVVHAFATKPCIWGRIAAGIARVPVIIGTIPGLGSLYSSDSLRVRTTRWVYERLQTVAIRVSALTILQNRRDAEELRAAGVVTNDNSIVIPGSGVRTDMLDREAIPAADRERVREEIGVSPDTIVVLMVTRVIRSKGVLEFARAARRTHENTVCVLVGPDDRHSVDRLGSRELEEVNSSVVWLGGRSDIPTLLAASDVFALPTYYREGVPRVLLEAASMGLPLIATDMPGCVDIVDHGVNGLIVPVKDAEMLSEAINRLSLDERMRQRMGERSRERAVVEFDVSVVAARTAEVYHGLLGTGDAQFAQSG